MLRALGYDWRGAERAFLRALELDPQSVDVWLSYNYYYLAPMRRLDEAIAGTRKALERDPLSPVLQFQLGSWYYYARQNDRAMEQCLKAVDLDPHYIATYIPLAGLYWEKGEPDEAIRALEALAQLMGRSPFALGLLGSFYGMAGRTGEARKLIEELQELDQKTYVSPGAFAWIYYGLGEIDRAFDWFEKALDQPDINLLLLGVDPFWDPLRSHPRYHALLRTMNLE